MDLGYAAWLWIDLGDSDICSKITETAALGG
jgi:hypothetical protein